MYGIIRASNLCAVAATWPGYQVILIAVIKSEAGRGGRQASCLEQLCVTIVCVRRFTDSAPREELSRAPRFLNARVESSI